MSLLARTVGRISWSFPARTAWRLHRFALAEQASMIDLVLAARATPSPARAAAYLAHAADEARHCRMFTTHAREWAERAGIEAPPAPHADVEHLYQTLGEVAFLALVYRGERHGRRDFEAYRALFARRGETKTAALFEAVVADERRHEESARALLVEVAGDEGAARRALARAALRDAFRAWMRLGRAWSSALYVVTTALLYLACAPLALAVRLARPAPRGFVRAG